MRSKLDKPTVLLYFFALLTSFFISTWIDLRDAVINPDGICYLFSAETVGSDGLSAAMHLCPQAIWPFYSLLIYVVTTITHLSTLNAAFLLDAVFSCVTVAAFIAIVNALGGSFRVMVLAAFVILLSHNFNILREDIIRDHGFWAAYLVSMWCLIRFYAKRSWFLALFFSVSLIIATSFRIEGAMFLLALPFTAWFLRHQLWSSRLSAFLKLNTLLILGGLVLLAYLVIHPNDVSQLGRLPEIVGQLHDGLDIMVGKYQSTKEAISQSVLTHASVRDAGVVVALVMLAWYLVNVVNNLSLIYSLLVVYAWCRRGATFVAPGLLVVVGYLCVNLIVTFGFFAENHFLAKRYLIALTLVLMLWVPFILDKLYASKEVRHKIILAVASIFILISGLGSLLHFGHSKQYIRDAGDWLAVNVPKDAKIYTNDYQTMYYSQHVGKDIFKQYALFKDIHVIQHGHWQAFDFLALMRGTDGDDETAIVMQELHMAPIVVFVSGDGSHIYKVSHRGN